MPDAPSPTTNLLLATLSVPTRERLFPRLEYITLPLGMVVQESDDPAHYMYFPTDSIVSLLCVAEDGGSAEISVVGRDGAIGIALFMGGGSMPSRAIVQSAGGAYRLSAKHVQAEFNLPEPEFRRLMLRYTQALITQMAQTAYCNRHHSIVEQLCRWLLLSLDRLDSNKLVMTHELIANMLGVRREGVTAAAGTLFRAGAIEYHRGRITAINRDKLEEMCCECYAVVKKETDRLMAAEEDVSGRQRAFQR